MKTRKYGWVDKTADYRAWRYTWDHGGVHDVDQIEWVLDEPVAVLELTQSTDTIDDRLENSVRQRLWNQFSGVRLRRVAHALGVPFIVVIYRKDLQEYSICILDSPDAPFVRLERSQYRYWLSRLRPSSPLPSFREALTATTSTP